MFIIDELKNKYFENMVKMWKELCECKNYIVGYEEHFYDKKTSSFYWISN
jgi:hypothetical protein